MIEVREQDSGGLVNGLDYTREIRTLLDTDGFEVKEEVVNGVLFYHIDVFDNSLSTYKAMKAAWETLKRKASKEGWGAIHSYTQNHKFVRKFGGEMVAKVIGITGEEYGVYRWELKQ